TGDWHSEVIFKSDNIYGPYEPWNNNPILTQRHFLNNADKLVDWAGHADLVEGKDGKYYGVFLGIRPNTIGDVNTGRETFILPVDWSGTWPVFENGLVPMGIKQKMPKGVENKTGKDGFMPNGNFTYSDDFNAGKIDYRWVAMRGPKENFVKFAKNGGLEFTALDAQLTEVKPISALFHRQQHIKFNAQTTLTYNNKVAQKAGLICYQNEKCNYILTVQTEGKEQVLVVEKTVKGQRQRDFQTEVVAKQALGKLNTPITLKVTSDGLNYQFAYAVQGNEMTNIGPKLEAKPLSTNFAGGFTGALVGMGVFK
ncbi:MAG: family 43 glycosylhydrolase, partial [Prevotella sp.]|nr:family 43 glycosylhydrolase [Prevotella sp.]